MRGLDPKLAVRPVRVTTALICYNNADGRTRFRALKRKSLGCLVSKRHRPLSRRKWSRQPIPRNCGDKIALQVWPGRLPAHQQLQSTRKFAPIVTDLITFRTDVQIKTNLCQGRITR